MSIFECIFLHNELFLDINQRFFKWVKNLLKSFCSTFENQFYCTQIDLTWKLYTVQFMDHTLPYKKTVNYLALTIMTSYNDHWSTKSKKIMKKDCRNKIWLSRKSTSKNSACSTSIQSQLANYKFLTLAGPPKSKCKIGPKITKKN